MSKRSIRKRRGGQPLPTFTLEELRKLSPGCQCLECVSAVLGRRAVGVVLEVAIDCTKEGP